MSFKFHHSGDLGDLCVSLPTIRALGGGEIICSSFPPAREPMTQERIDFIAPLIFAQGYVTGIRLGDGGESTHNFAHFRDGYVKDTSLAELQRRAVIPYQRVKFHIPWLTVTPKTHGRAVFARSERYHNPLWNEIWPHFVTKWPNALFIGTKREHELFCAEFGHVEYQPVKDALEMAEIIAGSSVFVGNQSFPNSVAEGLKHNSILEVCPKARDCIYPRENAKHIEKLEDWTPAEKFPRIALALQIHPDNTEAGMNLVQLLVKIEEKSRDVEFWLFIRDDVDEITANEIAAEASSKFSAIRVIRSTRRGRGWPEGCNELWQSCMVLAARLSKSEKTNVEAVFTFEPDVVPLRRDWIDRLMRDWEAAKAEGRHLTGLFQTSPCDHFNGNGIFDINITRINQDLQSSSGPWDTHHGQWLTRNGKPSDAMVNLYQKPSITRAELDEIRARPEKPTLLHGVKDGSARALIRRMMEKGEF